VLVLAPRSPAQVSPAAAPQKVIIDTDIGDDIDDAFAVALALRSPELQILGVTTTFGDTETRAKLLDRFLAEVGRPGIPVAAGTPSPVKSTFTQRRYAESGHFAKPSHANAVDFLLQQIQRYPGEITLIAIGPLMNVGAAINKDPATFRKLKRVVLMGGSIKRGYGDLGYGPPQGPQPEWNILNDIPSAQKLFAAGVPLYVMPLDSTQLKMDGAPAPVDLLRVPVSAGLSQLVLTARPGVTFRCAKAPAKLCVVAEQTSDSNHVVLTAFDPIAGRGQELRPLDGDLNTNYSWDLSPDGTRVAFIRSEEEPIQIIPMSGEARWEISPNGWTTTESLHWTADGKGLFASGLVHGETALLLVDLAGQVHVLWRAREAGGDHIRVGAPSPDGRHVAISKENFSGNIWMIENF